MADDWRVDLQDLVRDIMRTVRPASKTSKRLGGSGTLLTGAAIEVNPEILTALGKPKMGEMLAALRFTRSLKLS